MTKSLLIEGWRDLNHSYSLVNQYQLLELKKLDLNLYHHDVLPYRTEWNSEKNFSGFEHGSVESICNIGPLPHGASPDTTYRISYPYNLNPSKIGALFVFGTSEFQVVTDDMVTRADKVLPYKDSPLKIITPSKWSEEGFLNAGFTSDQIEIVPHGVDFSIFRTLDPNLRAHFRSLLGATKDSFIILSIGAMTTNKGMDVLLDAYLQLKPRYPQIHLVLKDQSNLYRISGRDAVQLYCKERGIDPSSLAMSKIFSDIFLVSDNLNFDQLNSLYNAADCYVSPYRAEGFNLPPLEAAAAGVPIIVTKGGSTDDYVDPSFALQIESKKLFQDGKYFLEPNVDSLVEKIDILISKKNIQLNSDNARLFLEKNFSWTAATQKLFKILFNK